MRLPMERRQRLMPVAWGPLPRLAEYHAQLKALQVHCVCFASTTAREPGGATGAARGALRRLKEPKPCRPCCAGGGQLQRGRPPWQQRLAAAGGPAGPAAPAARGRGGGRRERRRRRRGGGGTRGGGAAEMSASWALLSTGSQLRALFVMQVSVEHAPGGRQGSCKAAGGSARRQRRRAGVQGLAGRPGNGSISPPAAPVRP